MLNVFSTRLMKAAVIVLILMIASAAFNTLGNAQNNSPILALMALSAVPVLFIVELIIIAFAIFENQE